MLQFPLGKLAVQAALRGNVNDVVCRVIRKAPGLLRGEGKQCFAQCARLHVKHLHATVLNQMGLDPNNLSYFYGGLDQKLVGVEGADPIQKLVGGPRNAPARG